MLKFHEDSKGNMNHLQPRHELELKLRLVTASARPYWQLQSTLVHPVGHYCDMGLVVDV